MNSPARVALVSGCSRAEGIGFEVCRQLAGQGITVLLTARDPSRALELAASLSEQGLDVMGHALDISDSESVDAIVAFIAQRYGRLDILVNNATGAGRDRAPPSDSDLAGARQVLDVTLLGNWRMIQSCLPLLRESEAARVVNVSSSAGLHGDPVLGLTGKSPAGPAYSIAKAALNALTAKFAHELRDTGIKVNAVCPGFTASWPGMEKVGARPVPDGAAGIVWAATLDEDGPTGGFYRDEQPQPW